MNKTGYMLKESFWESVCDCYHGKFFTRDFGRIEETYGITFCESGVELEYVEIFDANIHIKDEPDDLYTLIVEYSDSDIKERIWGGVYVRRFKVIGEVE